MEKTDRKYIEEVVTKVHKTKFIKMIVQNSIISKATLEKFFRGLPLRDDTEYKLLKFAQKIDPNKEIESSTKYELLKYIEEKKTILEEELVDENNIIDNNLIVENSEIKSIDILYRFLKSPGETLVFIDGMNLYKSVKEFNSKRIDYSKLWQFFSTESNLIRINYYSPTSADNEYNPIVKLLDYLKYNNFTVISRPATYAGDRIKGNLDAEIITDMVSSSFTIPNLKNIVLFSGDGDFMYPIIEIKKRGIRVIVISVKEYSTSNKLREVADLFIDVNSLNLFMD